MIGRKRKPLNVLLLISKFNDPPPELEIAELAKQSQEEDPVYFVTTRTIKDLRQGASKVVWYAQKEDNHKIWGSGIYMDYIEFSDPFAQEILRESPKVDMYRKHGIPRGAKGLIEVSNVRVAKAGETVKDLRAIRIIKKSNERIPLSPETIPDGHPKLQIYWIEEDAGD